MPSWESLREDAEGADHQRLWSTRDNYRPGSVILLDLLQSSRSTAQLVTSDNSQGSNRMGQLQYNAGGGIISTAIICWGHIFLTIEKQKLDLILLLDQEQALQDTSAKHQSCSSALFCVRGSTKDANRRVNHTTSTCMAAIFTFLTHTWITISYFGSLTCFKMNHVLNCFKIKAFYQQDKEIISIHLLGFNIQMYLKNNVGQFLISQLKQVNFRGHSPFLYMTELWGWVYYSNFAMKRYKNPE